MKFDGRILILGTAPDAMKRQLAGEDLTLAEAGELRSDISTDEITPLPILLNYDSRLGRYAHTGLTINGEKPLGENAIAGGGFAVLVGGRRYGKGSSREHSPLAEYSAGIRLVIAESFERIYRQNCDNIGLFTSTDFNLIDRIRAGERISIDELVAERDPLAQAILRAGGLLAYGATHLRNARLRNIETAGPRTLAQKIVDRSALMVDGLDWDARPGTGGFVRADFRFIHEYYTAMAAHMLHEYYGRPLALHEPDNILLFEDHLSYAHRSPTHLRLGLLPDVRAISQAHRDFAREYGLTDHGYLIGEDGSEGISHAMMAESYALPGRIVVGTDSHTPHSGAIGAFAYGVGTTDMANAFVTGAVRLTMAESLLVRLTGQRRPGVTAKDIVLNLLAQPFIREGGGVGRIFEFAGPVIDAMSIDERTTITNMVAELGGLTGLCAPDAETVRFLKERRGIDFQIEDWMRSDPGAAYAATIEMDCSGIGPMLAMPGDPGNGIPLVALDRDVRVDIAYGGSCTAGKRDDFDNYHAVARWAQERGLRVADGVRLYLQCGTVQVRDYCREQGYMETFEAIGAEMLGPACGSCGQCGPGVSETADQVTISAINRNFPGRGGPGQTWLASPPTVIASAIAGRICSFEALQAMQGLSD
ncbi:MAG: aconitase family protein [Paracoccus sp. (in: a-proteobacteria)]|uniref:aconitase family protein n=1 Tax=Paracoccus sp. TaxID=267 RepID=UPI0026DFAC51|nr:aconitase family protein [Paracoccus sp. (in: a-proteobacteria)]MDO5631607.1 aconitase family protein [Paracoccus sp. (in: a-proteobacteria)]